MISLQAAAVHEAYRARRRNPAPAASTLAEQRAAAERVGDATTEPSGVGYEPVDAGGVPAQWVMPRDADPSRVLLYFHAGGYGYCSMHSHRKLIGHIARAAGCRALNVDYRLAPEHPHPAALDDARTAYRWLLGLGVESRNVAAVGDSAGGGLALALLVRARDEGLPTAGAGALMSPWVDLAFTGPNSERQAARDLLTDPGTNAACAARFLAGRDPRDPYASPLYADLSGLPQLYVQVGDAELFHDDAVRLADKARRSGTAMRLDVFPEMQHDFQMFAGAVPEADDAVARLGAFLDDALRPRPATSTAPRRAPDPRRRPQ